jgi:iron(III) transport system substrate-binding protein
MQFQSPAKSFAAAALAVVALSFDAQAQDTKTAEPEVSEINVHTTREAPLIRPLLRLFEGLTKVKVNDVYLTGDWATRLASDTAAGKVDLFIATEFGQLTEMKSRGLTEPVVRGEFLAAIPARYRDPEGHWFGLTRRMRILAVAPNRPSDGALSYESLAEPVWKGKVCLRSGLHPYNVGLVASMIAHKGGPFTEEWLQGVKGNLARPPKGGDRDQIAAVATGECGVAIVNSYYIAGHEAGATGAKPVKVFPNAADRGAHVSVSGMAEMKGAKHKKTALLLMDFLTSKPVQFVYAHDNHEYPIRTDVRAEKLLAGWGTPKEDTIALEKLAALQSEAAELIRKVRFDEGPEAAASR